MRSVNDFVDMQELRVDAAIEYDDWWRMSEREREERVAWLRREMSASLARQAIQAGARWSDSYRDIATGNMRFAVTLHIGTPRVVYAHRGLEMSFSEIWCGFWWLLRKRVREWLH